jgi:hypothetical protein
MSLPERIEFWYELFTPNKAEKVEDATAWQSELQKWHSVAVPVGAILALVANVEAGAKGFPLSPQEFLQVLSKRRLVNCTNTLHT